MISAAMNPRGDRRDTADDLWREIIAEEQQNRSHQSRIAITYQRRHTPVEDATKQSQRFNFFLYFVAFCFVLVWPFLVSCFDFSEFLSAFWGFCGVWLGNQAQIRDVAAMRVG